VKKKREIVIPGRCRTPARRTAQLARRLDG